MKFKLSIWFLFFLMVTGCNPNSQPDQTLIDTDDILENKVITKAEQAKLTPDSVIKRLKSGNQDFVEDRFTVRNTSERVRQAALGQYPKAVVLSCLDSRVPVEDVFHKGIGDLFVARLAGNVVNEDVLGSLEYACKVSGAKVIMVLGHEYCGAIKSAVDGVELGNITSILNKIKPAIVKAKTGFTGEITAKNEKFIEAVCNENVLLAIAEIRYKSPILKTMEKNGEIKIIGGVYNIKTGVVDFFDL